MMLLVTLHGTQEWTPLFGLLVPPDLKRIESLWKTMKDCIKSQHTEIEIGRPISQARLVETQEEAWDAIRLERLRRLMTNMPDRCQAVSEANSGAYMMLTLFINSGSCRVLSIHVPLAMLWRTARPIEFDIISTPRKFNPIKRLLQWSL